MNKLKSTPLSLRIDEKLHEVLTDRANKSDQTLNSYIRERLYEMEACKDIPEKPYENIENRVKEIGNDINENLSNVSKSIASIQNEANNLIDRIDYLKDIDSSLEKSFQAINLKSLLIGKKLNSVENHISEITLQVHEQSQLMIENMNKSFLEAQNKIDASICNLVQYYESDEVKKTISGKINKHIKLPIITFIILFISVIILCISVGSLFFL